MPSTPRHPQLLEISRDGGFVAVVAYDRSDLVDLLTEMDSHDTGQDG